MKISNVCCLNEVSEMDKVTVNTQFHDHAGIYNVVNLPHLNKQ